MTQIDLSLRIYTKRGNYECMGYDNLLYIYLYMQLQRHSQNLLKEENLCQFFFFFFFFFNIMLNYFIKSSKNELCHLADVKPGVKQQEIKELF